MDKQFKEAEKKAEKHYRFINAFVTGATRSEANRKRFFKHLAGYVEAEIELEAVCNE